MNINYLAFSRIRQTILLLAVAALILVGCSTDNPGSNSSTEVADSAFVEETDTLRAGPITMKYPARLNDSWQKTESEAKFLSMPAFMQGINPDATFPGFGVYQLYDTRSLRWEDVETSLLPELHKMMKDMTVTPSTINGHAALCCSGLMNLPNDELASYSSGMSVILLENEDFLCGGAIGVWMDIDIPSDESYDQATIELLEKTKLVDASVVESAMDSVRYGEA